MGSILDINFNDVPEISAVPEGEYQVSVLDAEMKEKDDGETRYLVLRFEVVGKPDALDIVHSQFIARKGDTEKRRIQRLNTLRKMLKCLGVATDGPIQLENLLSKTGWVVLSEEENPEYGRQNRIKQFVTAGK